MSAAAILVTACASRAAGRRRDISGQFAEIESRIGGRLGVHARDTGSGERVGFRDDERFAMCSTFKLPLAAAILARVDAGGLSLDQRIAYSAKDIVPYSPVTSAHLAEGAMSVRDLCDAIVTVSDNAAANLLLPLIGGPAGLTQFVRDLGDAATRLDRLEPELNTNEAGDVRDTTTPRAMVRTMEKLLVAPTLSQGSREQLNAWLVAATRGLERIRAGLPAEWKTGNKSGTGMNGAINDVAITWPTGQSPWLIAIYLSGSTAAVETLEAAHEQVAALVTRAFRT